jgi:hypothetical protein
VEGFADFFGVWIPSDRLTGPGGSRFSDVLAESNTYRTIGDGAKIEGAVAGFIYDIVDGPADPDGPNNETGVDDDTITWPATYVSDLISKCDAQVVGIWFTAIDGIDEFIHCAEHDTSGPNAANPFGTFRNEPFRETAVEPSGWSATTVRSLWRFNLYGLGGLP